jgi:hypothetical protein
VSQCVLGWRMLLMRRNFARCTWHNQKALQAVSTHLLELFDLLFITRINLPSTSYHVFVTSFAALQTGFSN